MKRILLSVLALSLVLSGSAFATVRTNGMAIDQDDTMDYGNIYAFPHLTGKYANILSVVPETLGSWRADGELLINLGDKTITLGYASGAVGFLGGSTQWSSLSGFLGYGGTSPDQKLQLGFAMPMGSGLLGARFSWSRYSYSETTVYTDDTSGTVNPGHFDEEYIDKSGQIKVELGYGMEDAGPFKSVDIGAAIALGSGEASYEQRDLDGDPTTNTGLAYREGSNVDGATDISVRLRAVKEVGDGSLVVNVGFLTGSVNGEYFEQDDSDQDGDYQTAGVGADDDDTYRVETKGSQILVGAAYNKPINDGGLLVIALRLVRNGNTWTESETVFNAVDGDIDTGLTAYESKYSEMFVPLSVGVEDKLSDTFKGRLGLKKNILVGYNLKETEGFDYDNATDSLIDSEVYEESETYQEDAILYIGLSATKGKFYSDWVIEHDIFWNGPNFLFGGSSNFAAEWEVGLTF